MDLFEGMQAFCRTVERGSLSAAARDLGVSRSLISRRIGQLESELGAKLFHRTTRSLSLTHAGSRYYPEAERILTAVEQSRQQLCEDVMVARGLIRFGIPSTFGERYVVPELAGFLSENPDVRIFLQVSEGLSDLHADELDLVLRIGILDDSNFRGVRLFETDSVLAATPAYFANRPPLTCPEDLSDHNCFCYRDRGLGSRWHLRWKGKPVEVPVGGSFSADSGVSMREMAVRGLGVVLMPRCLIADELATGQLQQLLPEATRGLPKRGVWLVFHPDRFQPLRVTRLIEYLQSKERRYCELAS
jgi:DNA-binding transcriptional LysR family regulator